jgi:hypothetical protein
LFPNTPEPTPAHRVGAQTGGLKQEVWMFDLRLVTTSLAMLVSLTAVENRRAGSRTVAAGRDDASMIA